MARKKTSSGLRRALYPAYRRLETIVHPLRYLFLEITQRCNLDCLHCGSDCGSTPQRNELTTEEWFEFLDYLAGKTTPSKLFLVFTGGEPLCHPRVWEIFRKAKSHGFPYGLVTNGFLLNETNVAKIADAGATSGTVSIDGLKESHDWLRGTPGSFERAVRGAQLMAGLNLPFFDVVTCVNPRNLNELPAMLELLRSNGIRRWRLFNIFPKGRAKRNPQLHLSAEQHRQMFLWIAETRRELVGTSFHLDFSCEGFLPPSIDLQVRDEPYFCRAGIAIGSVLCDGSISACPNITRELVQGNIRTDDFMETWENRFEKFRNRNWMRTGECEDCSQWSGCKGNSMHLWDPQRKETALCYHTILERDLLEE